MNSTATATISRPRAATATLHGSGNRPRAFEDRSARLELHGPTSARRHEIEMLVQREYRRHFDADIREFMPHFLSLHDEAGEILAVVGCRSAAMEALFLEVYVDGPIEELISEQASTPVSRAEIVEIGSLVCRNGRAAMAMIRALIPFLVAHGFEWVAFTGADTVVRVLRSLHLLPLALCAADRDKLGAARAAWGSYYEHDPIVMAGRLRDGLAFLQADATPR